MPYSTAISLNRAVVRAGMFKWMKLPVLEITGHTRQMFGNADHYRKLSVCTIDTVCPNYIFVLFGRIDDSLLVNQQLIDKRKIVSAEYYVKILQSDDSIGLMDRIFIMDRGKFDALKPDEDGYAYVKEKHIQDRGRFAPTQNNTDIISSYYRPFYEEFRSITLTYIIAHDQMEMEREG